MTVEISGFDCELADGVRETTQTTGTGTYQLDGPATIEGTTYRSFVAGVGTGVRAPYAAWFGNEFEIGLGTVTSGAPATISRDTILLSSNSNNAVSWGPGVKDIYLDAPSSLLEQIWERPTFHDLRATQTTTSGTEKDFTSIEADAFRLTVMFNGVRTSGTSRVVIQIGDSGGIETTGYINGTSAIDGSSTSTNTATGSFAVTQLTTSSDLLYGAVTLTLMSASTDTWIARGGVWESNAQANHTTDGIKSLSGTLDRVRVTTAGGSDTFSAGSVGLLVEYMPS